MSIVLDTNTIIRALAGHTQYKDCLDRIYKKCDTIIVSKEIEKEYRGKIKKGGMTSYIFDNKIKELENKEKYKRIDRSRIEARLRNFELDNLPNDHQDHKFFRLAIAENARYIITIDSHLLEKNPYRYNRNYTLLIIKPEDYEPQIT